MFMNGVFIPLLLVYDVFDTMLWCYSKMYFFVSPGSLEMSYMEGDVDVMEGVFSGFHYSGLINGFAERHIDILCLHSFGVRYSLDASWNLLSMTHYLMSFVAWFLLIFST